MHAPFLVKHTDSVPLYRRPIGNNYLTGMRMCTHGARENAATSTATQQRPWCTLFGVGSLSFPLKRIGVIPVLVHVQDRTEHVPSIMGRKKKKKYRERGIIQLFDDDVLCLKWGEFYQAVSYDSGTKHTVAVGADRQHLSRVY